MLTTKEKLIYASVQGFAWGTLRGIHTGSSADAQLSKMGEEAQELLDAINADDNFEIVDAVGDIWQCYLMVHMVAGGDIDSIIKAIDNLEENHKDWGGDFMGHLNGFVKGRTPHGIFIMAMFDKFGFDFVSLAYDQALATIKPRRGKMIDGKFVKEV